MFDKKALFEMFCECLKAMVDGARNARKVSERESRSHKGAMSSRFDTFKEEAQALAGGQGRREADLSKQLALVKSLLQEGRVLEPVSVVQVGAVVHVAEHDSETESYYLIVPGGGGLEFHSGDTKFNSLNFSSPLGRALFHKEKDDVVEFRIEGQNKRRLRILEIQ